MLTNRQMRRNVVACSRHQMSLYANADRRALTLTTFAGVFVSLTSTTHTVISVILYINTHHVHLTSDKILITSSKIDQLQPKFAYSNISKSIHCIQNIAYDIVDCPFKRLTSEFRKWCLWQVSWGKCLRVNAVVLARSDRRKRWCFFTNCYFESISKIQRKQIQNFGTSFSCCRRMWKA